ncbi:MAG TPA: hypothetical protein VN174_03110 [Candidatus Methanoperedens sp.]|nr:hypothetical protein [Candidatus Methanoperedens sp.]
MERKDFLPSGLEPKSRADIEQIRSLLFDPTLSSTSERIVNAQINPGNPNDCWTLTSFEDTVVESESKSIYSSTDIPVQPCRFCRVNFVCYPKTFQKPISPDTDIIEALNTIENQRRN